MAKTGKTAARDLLDDTVLYSLSSNLIAKGKSNSSIPINEAIRHLEKVAKKISDK